MGSSEPVITWASGMAVGRYVLLREIARGGMGEIWLAHQKGPARFERLVVIKRVIASEEEDSAFVTMFLDEARIASQLHHPNVVQVFELGEYHGSYFLVMEYLPGQTLGRVARRILEQSGSLPQAVAAEIVSGAAAGLGYAHRRRDLDGRALQIVHRDVSPQNLLITYDGHVKVLDFGIAQAVGRLTRTATGTVRGKLAYMSPEQALGSPITATTDVFALGAVLHELLTGTRLWGKVEDVVLLQALATLRACPRVSERNPQVDGELDDLVARALNADPELRFADGQAMHEALEQWLRRQRSDRTPLEQVMRQTFHAEIEHLPEFHRATVLTPSAGNSFERSLPGNTPARSPAPTSTLTPTPALERPPRRTLPLVLAGALAAVVSAGGTAVLLKSGLLDGAPPPAPVVAPVVDAGVKVVAPPEPGPAVADAGAAAPVATPSADAGTGTPNASVVVKKAGKGFLSLQTDPWTTVLLGSKKLGETPLIEVPLPEGRYQLRLVNEAEHIDTVIEVNIVAGRTTTQTLSP